MLLFQADRILGHCEVNGISELSPTDRGLP